MSSNSSGGGMSRGRAGTYGWRRLHEVVRVLKSPTTSGDIAHVAQTNEYKTTCCLTCLDRLETKHLPELRPRSIVSLTDHRPRSTSCTAGWLNVCGEASSRPSNSAFTGEALIAFFASARFSAICSRRLSCTLGEGGRSSSAGSGWGRLAGDFVGDRGFKLLRLG